MKDPIKIPPPNYRPALIILGLIIGIPLLIVGAAAFLLREISPHYDSVVWYYDDFQINGSPSGADQFDAERVLPTNIVVEATKSRFDEKQPPHEYPRIIVEPDGRRVELSTITWDSAKAMSKEGPFELQSGEHVIQMLDPIRLGSSHLSVDFARQRFKTLSAYGAVRVHNTANKQYLDLSRSPKWSDVERVFGKPNKKEKKRVYHNRWG